MALTKDERRALELARANIAAGESKFVCNALKEVASKNPALRGAEKTLLAYIDQALEGRFTLLMWQQDNDVFKGGNDDSLRPDRLAWIDWMLGKPLPGEAVKLEWSSRTLCKDEAEYCGRTFVCYYADGKLFVDETTEGSNKYLGAFASVEQADAAIVAHVWPEA
ncbi:hypothetical protein FEE59_13610 [Herbaspirillum sp. RU 5E]|nr:hypothetical protein [Herbaspirillum sp. RU 5E]